MLFNAYRVSPDGDFILSIFYQNVVKPKNTSLKCLACSFLSSSAATQVTKRDEDSSLMQLKEEFRTYEALRREHDSQIVQIAMEGGLRIAPDQWSSLLYGDQSHKSHMQSIIDKVCEEQLFILECTPCVVYFRNVLCVALYAAVSKLLMEKHVPSLFFFPVSGIAADPSVICSECSGADNCAAADWRSSQPQQAAAPPGASGQH